jgi:hypothetical protein
MGPRAARLCCVSWRQTVVRALSFSFQTTKSTASHSRSKRDWRIGKRQINALEDEWFCMDMDRRMAREKEPFCLAWTSSDLRHKEDFSVGSNPWATPPVCFALVILEMGVSHTICPGWPWTLILLISASQVPRTVGLSHGHPAQPLFLKPGDIHGQRGSKSRDWLQGPMPLPGAKLADTVILILLIPTTCWQLHMHECVPTSLWGASSCHPCHCHSHHTGVLFPSCILVKSMIEGPGPGVKSKAWRDCRASWRVGLSERAKPNNGWRLRGNIGLCLT